MRDKARGFTLIELLVVVAIVGILAALLIPNLILAVQKAKQKGTMQDIANIATAMTDYITDNANLPTQSGDLVAGSVFHSAMSPFYLKVLPERDQWGTPFKIYAGTAVDSSGYSNVTATGYDDFLVVSWGRNGAQDPFNFDPSQPSNVYFALTGMESFAEDLVNWNGQWIHVPRTAQANITP